MNKQKILNEIVGNDFENGVIGELLPSFFKEYREKVERILDFGDILIENGTSFVISAETGFAKKTIAKKLCEAKGLNYKVINHQIDDVFMATKNAVDNGIDIIIFDELDRFEYPDSLGSLMSISGQFIFLMNPFTIYSTSKLTENLGKMAIPVIEVETTKVDLLL